jgi:hypothetical protein
MALYDPSRRRAGPWTELSAHEFPFLIDGAAPAVFVNP